MYKLDAGMLPPCLNALAQKLRRTQMVAKRWMNAAQRQLPEKIPQKSG